MKIACIIISVISLLCTLYCINAVLINRNLNRKKKAMFIKKRDNKYVLFLAIFITIFITSSSYLALKIISDAYNPIETFDLSTDYEQISDMNNYTEISIKPAMTLLKDYNVDVEDDNNVYGITSTKLYKIDYEKDNFISVNSEKDSIRRDILILKDYVVISYAYDKQSKVVIYSKFDLHIIKNIRLVGEVIALENVDDKISLLVCNDINNKVSVQIENEEPQYLKELKCLKDYSVSKIVSHVLINIDNNEIIQKGFCFEDFFFVYDECFYLVGNMYNPTQRENKCFAFKYDPKRTEIVNYAFFYGNIYMVPYSTDDYIYMNTYDNDNGSFYSYQLDTMLNVCSRVGVDIENNIALDYLHNCAKVYYFGGELVVSGKAFTQNWSALRDDDEILVLQKETNELHINRYDYETNTFDEYIVPFDEDLNECVVLSYNHSENEIKVLFRTNDKVGYMIINPQNKEAKVDIRGNGVRMFLTNDNIIIIDGNNLEIVNKRSK